MFFRSFSREHKRLLFFLSRKFFFVHPFVLIFPGCECLGSIARLPAAFREMSLHSYSRRPQGSLRSKRFGVVSEQRKTDERRGTGFSVLAARKMERELTPSQLFFAVRQQLKTWPNDDDDTFIKVSKL